MIGRFILLFFTFIFITGSFSQSSQKDKLTKPDSLKLWKYNIFGSLSTTQSAYMNWSAGGENSISLNGLLRVKFKYETKKFYWDNSYNFALGMNILFQSKSVAKTDDDITMETKAGYKFSKKVALVGVFGFKTQFTHGYFPDESHFSSSFMAPGYFSPSIAIEYRPVKGLSIIGTPVKSIITIVDDQRLANAGAFGVKGADYDSDGNIINLGDKVRYQLGSYLSIAYAKNFTKSIAIDTRINFYLNYLQEKPENIDVWYDLLLKFKIKDWLTSYLQVSIVYDDDIKVPTENGNMGPRLQLKQILGLGLAYTIKNHDFK